MRKSTRWLVASAIGGTALIANASLGFLTVEQVATASLSDLEMSSMRGGFVSVDNNVINIGLSINTAINGETVLSTHIADFTINNGVLTSRDGSKTYNYADPLQVIKVGENNIYNGTPGSDATGVVVQNSYDGTVINTQTVLDIEADIDGYNRHTLFKNQLESAILFNGY